MKTMQARKLPARSAERKGPGNGNGAGSDARGKASGNGAETETRGKPKVELKAGPVLSQREQLEQEREETNTELARLRAELQQAPEPTGDEVDLSVYDRERTLSLIANYERRLQEIDYALEATQKGAYGTCERCGKPIDPARLKIFPETTLCVTCKNEKEKRAKRGLL